MTPGLLSDPRGDVSLDNVKWGERRVNGPAPGIGGLAPMQDKAIAVARQPKRVRVNQRADGVAGAGLRNHQINAG